MVNLLRETFLRNDPAGMGPVSSLEHCIICEKILFGVQVVDLHLKVHPKIVQSNVWGRVSALEGGACSGGSAPGGLLQGGGCGDPP